MRVDLDPLGPRDADFRWAVFEQTMLTAVQRHTGLDDAQLRGMLTSQLSGGRHRAVVVDGVRAGVLAVTGSDRELAVEQIEILPAFQGRGLGRRLLGDVLADGRRTLRPVVLDVFADNAPAQALYASLGFREVGQDGHQRHLRWDP